MEDLSPANPIVKHLVDELIVECTLRTAGCPHTCQRQLLESHIKESCQYVTVPCSEEGCGQLVLRKDRGKHVDVCVHRTTQCDGCGASVRYTDLGVHHLECSSKIATCSSCCSEFLRSELLDHEATCSEVRVPCTHVDNGCSWIGTRRDLSTLHLPSCPYESIKGFFAVNGARVSALSAENTALKQKVQALEGIVQLIQQEMRSFKTILGPWYRSEAQRASRQDNRLGHVVNDSNLQGFAGPSTSRTVAHRVQASTIPDPFDIIDTEHDAVASFFSPDVVYEPQNHNHTQTHRVSGSLLDTHSYPGHPALPITPVAPLNLTTSLEGSLVGLRDSITTVAASVDSLARRNEIALTNENMRINEELGSLKYAVHGIRLQLHRLMMDRNAQVTGRMGEPASSSPPVPIPAPVPPQPALHPPMMTPPFPPPPGTKL